MIRSKHKYVTCPNQCYSCLLFFDRWSSNVKKAGGWGDHNLTAKYIDNQAAASAQDRPPQQSHYNNRGGGFGHGSQQRGDRGGGIYQQNSRGNYQGSRGGYQQQTGGYHQGGGRGDYQHQQQRGVYRGARGGYQNHQQNRNNNTSDNNSSSGWDNRSTNNSNSWNSTPATTTTTSNDTWDSKPVTASTATSNNDAWGSTSTESTNNDSWGSKAAKTNATDNNGWNTPSATTTKAASANDSWGASKAEEPRASNNDNWNAPSSTAKPDNNGCNTRSSAKPTTINITPAGPAASTPSNNAWGNKPASVTQQKVETNSWSDKIKSSSAVTAPTAPATQESNGWDDPPKESTGGSWGTMTMDSLGWANTGKKPKDVKEEGKGIWKDGVHELGEDNEAMRLKLFGTATDHESTHSGINFDKYENIPVETTGENIPEGINQVNF
jgi:hypothetical protein